MRLTCPGCGACGSLEFFLQDAAERRSLVAALKMPAPLAERIVAYLALFRPGKRNLTWDRVEKLLGELMPPIQERQVERHGRTWPAPLEYWQAAFDELLAKRETLRLPLKSHGYLFEIVAGMANKAQARGEAKREEERRHGVGPRGGEAAPERTWRSGGRFTDELIEREMQRISNTSQEGSDGD